jgi:hypothetical protein
LKGEDLEKLKRIVNESGKGFSSFKEAHKYVTEVLKVKLTYITVYKILVQKEFSNELKCWTFFLYFFNQILH